MLTTYIKSASGGLELTNFEQSLVSDIVWIDLCDTTLQEEQAVESQLGISVPTREEMHEIELSSRLYTEHGVIYATAMIITKTDTHEPESHTISFVLGKQVLITVRYSTPRSFTLVANRLCKPRTSHETTIVSNGGSVFLALSDAVVDRLADILENVGHDLDALGRTLFRPALTDKKARDAAKPNYDAILRQIGVLGDMLSKTRESLGSMSRMLSYMVQNGRIARDAEDFIRIQELLGDIAPLNDHANFLANKVGFLLNATLGMIGMEQNGTIKIFSVAAVVFLPPTLLASIYGMNFRHMPELDWHYGYPIAIGLMLLAAWLPYQYFKRKKWL